MRVQFCPDKIREMKASGPVTVANMRERQEALAAVHTHGKIFFVTGGEHVTSNDMLIAVELNQRNAEVTEREKEKKSQVEYHVRREAALPIVDRLQNNLEMILGGLKAWSWRFCSGGTVCPCRRWGTSITDAFSTNNLQRELQRR